MKHAHLIGHKVLITRLPDSLGYLKNSEGELVTIQKYGYLSGPGLMKPYAVLAFGEMPPAGEKGRGIHMNISLDNEDDYSLEDLSPSLQ